MGIKITTSIRINGLVQDCSTSSALAMETPQSCTKRSTHYTETYNTETGSKTSFPYIVPDATTRVGAQDDIETMNECWGITDTFPMRIEGRRSPYFM